MRLSVAFLLLSFALPPSAPAEVFVLQGGGRITGELLNADESPRQTYVVKTADGATVTLAAKQVQEVLRPRPDEIEYERIRPTYPDTVAGQWELAEWCREHRLPMAVREPHLRRVIELDPDHVQARHALGYSKIDGQWKRPEDVMKERGYIRYHGAWMLPQQIKLAEKKREHDAIQGEWMKNVKLWRSWFGTRREEEARENIRNIPNNKEKEPTLATKALSRGLRDDNDASVRMLFVETLARLDTGEGALALADAAMFDSVAEVRQTCLDHLLVRRWPQVTAYFVGKLKDKDNKVVNLAGVALGRLKDPAAIRPLIDALVTTHKFTIPKPGGNGAMSAGFGKGGGGLSMGGGAQTVRKTFNNQDVLDALLATVTAASSSEAPNFNFDKQAWKHWYAAQKKPAAKVDARRDGKE